MAWYNPYGILTGGIDVDAEQKRAEDLRKQELALQDRKRAAGGYASNEAFVSDRERVLAEPLFGYRTDDQGRNIAINDARAEVLASAAEGAKEGAISVIDGTAGAISGTLNTVGGFAWRAIPWWVWIAGIGYLVYVTGFYVKILRRFGF